VDISEQVISMPEKVGLTRRFGIAGKDTVAAALVAYGINHLEGPNWYVGAACLALGFGLLLIQQFIE
jgi:hypothetical protein